MKRLAGTVPLVVAIAAAAMFMGSGYGTRFGLWNYGLGFQILRASIYVGLAAAALALVALAIPKVRVGRQTALAFALVAGLASAYLPWSFFQQGRSYPRINDVTTDLDHPPAFDKILKVRTGATVPAEYPGPETADTQRRSYPDLKPLELPVSPDAAFARAIDASARMGWDIVSVDPAARRIEGVATTPWFGFKDDVVVRVTETPGGSRVDVRSVSRIGRADLGANARRIRAFLAKVAP